MAKAYQQFKKRAKTPRTLSARTNFVARISSLEIMLYELNSRIVRQIYRDNPDQTTLSEWDTDFLQAAEEFRSHLKGVVNGS